MVDKKRKHPKEIIKAEANSLNFFLCGWNSGT